MAKYTVTLELEPDTVRALETLIQSDAVSGTALVDVLSHLAQSAADGVRRPGAWERGWVEQCFGAGWQDRRTAAHIGAALLETDVCATCGELRKVCCDTAGLGPVCDACCDGAYH